MNDKIVASELKKIAMILVADDFDAKYEKTQKVVDMLSRKFKGIKGIQVLSDWSGRDKDVDSIHLGDAGEGGEIDGDYAALYHSENYNWNFGVNPKLEKELKRLGYDSEWYDSGTLLAYKD